MIRITSILIVILATALPLRAVAQGEAEPSYERSSAFVEGEVDPSEAFGPAQGPSLLILGLVALASIFVLLIVAKRIHKSNRDRLGRIAKQLLPEGDTDAS